MTTKSSGLSKRFKNCTQLNCSFCDQKIGYVGLSMTFYNRYNFFCSIECMKEGRHFLKERKNKKYSNLVDTSTYHLKKLTGLEAKKIPASLRIAMFKLFKIRRLIQCQKK